MSASCGSCRYWSELIAQVHGDETKALCLNVLSPRSSTYTSALATCQKHETGQPDDLGLLPPVQRAASEAYRQAMIDEDKNG